MKTLGQLFRYGIVGLLSNALLYAGYLGLTELGMEHKLAMTVLYTLGVALTFLFNRSWTFRYHRRDPSSFARYVASYVIGYLFNLAALYALVDVLGWPHRPVQGVLILMTAGLIFTLQKLWVFPEGRPPEVATAES